MRFFFVLLAVLFLAACTETPAPAEKKDTADSSASCSKPKPLNPNGDSELAILMREMAKWTEEAKPFAQKNELPPAFPDHFGKIMTAKSTDSTMDRITFSTYANSWLMAYDHFRHSDESDRKEKFNAIVNACAGCHDQFCPGPLKRIGKMHVAQ